MCFRRMAKARMEACIRPRAKSWIVLARSISAMSRSISASETASSTRRFSSITDRTNSLYVGTPFLLWLKCQYPLSHFFVKSLNLLLTNP